MERFSKLILLILCFGLVAADLTSPGRHVNAQTGGVSVRVTVENTPLPVKVENIPAVNVLNLPHSQQVSGTVNVGNLPSTLPVTGTVNVGNLPNPLPVNIPNSVGSPLLVRNVDDPAHNVISGQCKLVDYTTCQLLFNAPLGSTLIPSGFEVAIQYLSGTVQVPTGSVITNASISAGGFPSVAEFGVQKQGTVSIPITPGRTISEDYYLVAQPMRVYVWGPQPIIVSIETIPASNPTATINVSGYIVNCNIGPGCALPQGYLP